MLKKGKMKINKNSDYKDKNEYQYNYSDMHNDIQYDIEIRKIKGKKICAVLKDYFGDKELSQMKLLDVGCSTGIQTFVLTDFFDKVIGIDIDEKAILFAKTKFQKENLDYQIQNSMAMKFSDKSFDVVICSHVYEHVPSAEQLMREIHRVLKPGGICYFAATNKFTLIEPHYKLLFLSWIPKSLANRYVNLTGKAEKYYENLYSPFNLKRLTASFVMTDYTYKILENPEKFCATDMLKSKTLFQKISLFICKFFYFLIPNYIWVLKREGD